MKHIIKFDFTNIIEYSKYQSIIDELSKWYQEKRQYIENQYEKLIHEHDYQNSFVIIKEHNDIILELINQVIAKLDIKNVDIGIYLSCSYARGTNLLDSDIDLNFIYQNKESEVYEELISSILYQVLGKYRDFIHDSISHRLTNKTINPSDEVSYLLKFDNQEIEEEITKGNERLMYRLFNTKKDLNSSIKYYIGHLNCEEIDEWAYFEKLIYDPNNYVQMLLEYVKKHENGERQFNMEVYKRNLLANIDSELVNITKEVDDIADLKHTYKNRAFKIIYESLILLDKISNPEFVITNVEDKLGLLGDSKLENTIRNYFGYIMSINYACNLYGIEFRTRFKTKITDEFNSFYHELTGFDLQDNLRSTLETIYHSLKNKIASIEIVPQDESYNPAYEHINIANYSPLSHINNVSQEYQKNAFLLPFINISGSIIPIHPDTLDDLGISRKNIVDYQLVYPTSSTRTVYAKNENICYKLAVLRQITRSIRDMKNKELRRSEIASSELSKYSYPNFDYLKEECVYNEQETFNYIKREMPKENVYPWFYLIVSNRFDKEFMLKVIENMVNIWTYYASKGIYFESAHTQNFLVSDTGKIYYRDLSDIRILDYEIMRPSYLNELQDEKELHSIFFDRSMISQNIEHFIKYRQDITDEDIKRIKNIIATAIAKYNISFPNYSMNYDKNQSGHHPIKTDLVRLRKTI